MLRTSPGTSRQLRRTAYGYSRCVIPRRMYRFRRLVSCRSNRAPVPPCGRGSGCSGVNGVNGINGNVRTGKELAFKSVRVNYPEARMAGLFYIPNEK